MITNKIETITPEKAQGWLSRSKNPRKLKARHVQDFVRHLNGRTFELTHQGIALDENGYLVDGQHRLAAIVETGQELDMFVARGVTTKGIVMLDRGLRRDNSVVMRCEKSVAGVITLATRIAIGMGLPMESELLKFKRLLEDDITLMLEAYSRNQRRLSSSAIRLGAVINMHDNPDWVCSQWKAFNSGDFPSQCRSVQWLYRRVTGDRAVSYGQGIVYAFKAFNKENSSLESLTIKNVSANMDEIRKVLRSMAGMNPNITNQQ